MRAFLVFIIFASHSLWAQSQDKICLVKIYGWYQPEERLYLDENQCVAFKWGADGARQTVNVLAKANAAVEQACQRAAGVFVPSAQFGCLKENTSVDYSPAAGLSRLFVHGLCTIHFGDGVNCDQLAPINLGTFSDPKAK